MSCEELKKLFEDDWEWEMNDNPEYASQTGLRTPTSGYVLQDVTSKAFQKRIEHSKEMLKRIGCADFTQFSSDDARMFAPLFIQMHRDLIDGISNCPLYLMPINSMGCGGALYSFIESVEWMPFDNLEDYQSYLARLKSAPTQMQQFIEVMTEGISKQIVASTAMCRSVEGKLEKMIESNFPELRSPLSTPVALSVVDENLKEQFEIALNEVKTSFEKFLDFFHDIYLPNATFNPACSALPDGEAIYDQCLRYHTTGSWTSNDIHQMGLKEVARIEQRYIDDVLIPLGYKADEFAKFVEFAKTDGQFYVKTSEELLEHYKALCAKISEKMPEFFNEIPKSPLEIISKDVGPAAFYMGGTADGSRPGRFYVNCSDIEKRPLYEGVALALHEANPGHHHQCAVGLENEKLPSFMRNIEDRRYEIGAARRNMCTGYLEGWGLYCEYLGEEMGMYTTPYELFGRLSMEMMRAVRLVVDTGIHSLGWSLDKAIDYMMEKTGMHRHEVETEVYRYATWPGQATAYKVGEIFILQQRKYCETELGSRFNIKDFHSAVLQYGAIPLTFLPNLVQHYINAVGPEDEVEEESDDDSVEGSCPVLNRSKLYGDPTGKGLSAYPMAAAKAESKMKKCPFGKTGDASKCPVASAASEAPSCPFGKTGDASKCPVASAVSEAPSCPFGKTGDASKCPVASAASEAPSCPFGKTGDASKCPVASDTNNVPLPPPPAKCPAENDK